MGRLRQLCMLFCDRFWWDNQMPWCVGWQGERAGEVVGYGTIGKKQKNPNFHLWLRVTYRLFVLEWNRQNWAAQNLSQFSIFFYFVDYFTSVIMWRSRWNQEVKRILNIGRDSKAPSQPASVPAISHNSRKLFGDSSLFTNFPPKIIPFQNQRQNTTNFDHLYLLNMWS